MATLVVPIETKSCGCGSAEHHGTLARVRYFQRQLLSVDDMVTEQNYFREKLRRHNRYLHGWGVVCGLGVTAAPAEGIPSRVRITTGYALGPFGDEIYVEEPVYFDVERCITGENTDPCDPTMYRPVGRAAAAAEPIYLAIRYSECLSSPVRAMPPGCGCEETPCEYSRIRDSFEIGCVDRPVVRPLPQICQLHRAKVLTPCPPEPTDPWVVLARITLPASATAEITNQSIDNSVRRPLYSTAMIQEQLIRCCCGEREEPEPVPAQVTNINPANGISLTASPAEVVATFSKNMQAATINTSTFTVARIASTSGNATNVAGTVTYNDGNRTATFRPNTPFRTGNYRVTIIGTGGSPISDADNLVLDGDANGSAGGDFMSTFTIMAVPN